jgi:deoxyribodipyrimidine photo-lyase
VTSIVWFRDDLRLADHPALRAALERGGPVVLLYLLDEISPGIRPLGGATRWWLHHSLAAHAAEIARLGGTLVLRHGAAEEVLPRSGCAAQVPTAGRRRRGGELRREPAARALGDRDGDG